MTCTVWLVLDGSGSMLEGGKRFVARGIAHQVRQYVTLGYSAPVEVRLVRWGDEALPLEWSFDADSDVALLDCEGAVDSRSLRDLFDGASGRLVLLSDGFWNEEPRRVLDRLAEMVGPDAVRVIRIGADANQRLRGPEVFDAEALFDALDGWLGR